MQSRVPHSIGRRLRFAQLELVGEVVECGSLAEAAVRLHLTRAAVSKSIKELERSLGQQLFKRSAQGMTPTAAGLRVAKHARLLVSELRLLTDDVAAEGAGQGATLRVGMPPFVGEHVAPAVLRHLGAMTSPVVECIQIVEGRLNTLIEQLLRGEVDAVLSLYAPRAVDALDLSMLHVRPLVPVPMVVIASPELSVARRRHAWADLLRHPWILPPASTHQRRSLDEMFTARGNRAPVPRVESGSLAVNVQLAAQGLGLAVVPQQAAQADLSAGRLRVVDVRPALPETSIALLYRKVSAIYLDALQQLDVAVNAWAQEQGREQAGR